MISNEYSTDSLKEQNNLITNAPVIAVYKNAQVVDFIDYKNSDMKEKAMINLFRKYGLINYND